MPLVASRGGSSSSGYVVSDLHLLTRRTAAGSHRSRLTTAAAAADYFVLNGDIFDFRWSTLGLG